MHLCVQEGKLSPADEGMSGKAVVRRNAEHNVESGEAGGSQGSL